MESINIISINCTSNETLLSEKKIFSWENNPNKLINVFYMANGGGKTLLFTAINYMLAGINNNHFENNISITINLKIEINSIIYELTKTKQDFIIKSNETKISLEKYREIFNEAINNHEGLYSYSPKHKKKIIKNSIQSMFRFNFFSDNDLKKDSYGSQKSIELINSQYDRANIKNILGYTLGENFNKNEFNSIWEYTQIKNYLSSNKKIFDRYQNSNIGLFDNNLEEMYTEYSEFKQQLGDISIAIMKLNELIEKSNNYPEDKVFLEKEKTNFINLRNDIIKNKQDIKRKIEDSNFAEGIIMGIDSNKTIINKCINNKEKIESLKDEVEPIIKRIDDKINKFIIYLKNFIRNLDANLSVHFNTDKCIISLENGVNEGKAVLLRILFGIALNKFSNSNNGRIFNIMFLDTMMQGIDENEGKKLFEHLDKLYTENGVFPQLFIFITSIEDKYKINGLKNIQVIESSII